MVAERPRLVFVGESPGDAEVARGEPFVGASGKLLHAALDRFGVSREEVWITNAVLCAPGMFVGDKERLIVARDCCVGALLMLLQEARRRVENLRVGALGKIASETLGLESYLCWERRDGFEAIALPHPAYVLRSPDQASELFIGLRKMVTPRLYPGIEMGKITLVERPSDVDVTGGEVTVIDVESDGVNPFRNRVLLIGIGVLRGNVLDIYLVPERLAADVFKSTEFKNVGGHNFKFDTIFLRRYGGPTRVDWDTMLMAFAWNEYLPLGLKDLVEIFYDVPDYKKSLIEGTDFTNVDMDALSEYLCLDLYYTVALRQLLLPTLRGREGFLRLLFDGATLLSHMEYVGVQVDMRRVEELIKLFEAECETLRRRLCTITGAVDFNPNSPKQCAAFLYNGESKSTAAAELHELAEQGNPFAQTLLKYRRVQKLLSTYLYPLRDLVDDNGRVHPQWRQTGAVTGRLSAANPSIQNIPRPDDEEGSYGKLVRSVFTAREGCSLVAVDGSQWELRVTAGESGDAFMMDIYRKGGDIHGEVTRAVFGENYTKAQRAAVKRVVFGWLYGGSVESSAEVFQVPRDKVAPYVNRFNTTLAGAVRWREQQFEKARRMGFLQSRAGRRFHFPLITLQNMHDVRKRAVNYPIQGAASDLTIQAAIRCAERIQAIGGNIIILVHDSIVAEVPKGREREAAEIIIGSMVDEASNLYPEIPWDAEAEVGDNWGEMEELKI
jgi:DNA polymerase-1